MGWSGVTKNTPKRQRFVSEYLADGNARQAAIRAGYSSHTAESQGRRLLRAPLVAEAVQAGHAAIAERNGISADWVINELKANIEAAARQDPYQGAVINRALELIGKHIGMFQDQPAGTGAGPVSITVVYAGEPPGHEPAPAMIEGEATVAEAGE